MVGTFMGVIITMMYCSNLYFSAMTHPIITLLDKQNSGRYVELFMIILSNVFFLDYAYKEYTDIKLQ